MESIRKDPLSKQGDHKGKGQCLDMQEKMHEREHNQLNMKKSNKK